MNNNSLKQILTQVSKGKINIETALSILDNNNSSANSHLFIDHSRKERCGFPEFIYGAGKTAEQIAAAIEKIDNAGDNVLVTRISSEKHSQIISRFPQGIYDNLAETFMINNNTNSSNKGSIAIITAGTSDIAVAMEAKYTAELCNCEVNTYFDIGVAGIHRLFNSLEKIKKADVIISIAGMEGALPSVLAGLVSAPIIAVPTSVGYGTALNGFTALFAMLTSCASGVTVVNIDNGFGASCAAVRMLNHRNKPTE